MDKDLLKFYVQEKFTVVTQMMPHIAINSLQIEGLVVDENIKMSDLKGH